MASPYMLWPINFHFLILLVEYRHSLSILYSRKRGSLGCQSAHKMQWMEYCQCTQWRIWCSGRYRSFCFAIPSHLKAPAWTKENRIASRVSARISVRIENAKGTTVCWLINREVIASVLSLLYRVKFFLGHDLIWWGIKVALVTYFSRLHWSAKQFILIFLASFFEVFGTVIVSCAPALFSFWVNIVAPSDFHSSLRRSRLFYPRSSTSNSERKGGEGAAKNGLRHHFSLSSPKLNHTCKADGRKPYTEIYSSSSSDEPVWIGENVITKSTTIKQLSEWVICFMYPIRNLSSADTSYKQRSCSTFY